MPRPADASAPGTARTFSRDAGPTRRRVAPAPPSSRGLHSDLQVAWLPGQGSLGWEHPPAPHMPIEPSGELASPGL